MSDKIEIQFAIEQAEAGDYKSLIERFGFEKKQIELVRQMIERYAARRKT